jgi:hypothetical protein
MDLNVNELPETNDARLKPNRIERAVQPEARDNTRMIKVAGFLAVVVVLTTLAINSHQGSTSATMASDTPPAVQGATTMPTIAAPTDRTTTGSAPAAPTLAPNSPSEPNAAATSR